MAETKKLRFCKGDLLAIGLVILVATAVLLCFLPQKTGAAQAEIYLDGALLKTVDLQTDDTFTLSFRYNNTVTVSGGKIAITASDCPGRDCVHSGAIGSRGRSLVCLPNSLEIRVVASSDDVDFVVR